MKRKEISLCAVITILAISVADGHLFIRTAKNLYCIGK
jgi:hypothetical protein